MQLTAVVADTETALDRLIYEWSATPARGVFKGTGRQVSWVAPHLQPTPGTYTLTLTVTENYTSDGQARQHKVSRSVQVHYNDSYREIKDLGVDFLVNRFGNFNVSPKDCVANFSDSCPGKFFELEEIEENRRLFQILSAKFNEPFTFSFGPDMTDASMVGACVFEDIVKATGKKEIVTGICTLDAIYENWTWFLCGSSFRGTGTTPANLRYRVPGASSSGFSPRPLRR